MSIGVVGQGYVGGSLTTVFAERGEQVYVFDKTGKCADGGISALSAEGTVDRPATVAEFVQRCERGGYFSGIFFVCVPTPMSDDGSADVSIVAKVLGEIAETPPIGGAPQRIAVVKSTVPPGSVERWNDAFGDRGLHVVFNPEFLTEANALNDMRGLNRVVLGGPRLHIKEVRNLYQRLFPEVPIITTSSTTAEMVKYLTNCMLAVKVAFANEIAQICEALDADGLNIDYDEVVQYAKYDPRLGDTHWSVPGPVPTPDGRYVRGFGGRCLPKDINALMSVARAYGVDPKVMCAAWEKTLEVRGTQDRDWEQQVGSADTTESNRVPRP